MAMSPLTAWTIFKAVVEGKEEGPQAVKALVGEEAEQYTALTEQFNADIQEQGFAAQQEAATLIAAHPEVQVKLESTAPWDFTAADYRELVTVFEGSLYEKLHLSAFFRVNNTALLLDLVKPAA